MNWEAIAAIGEILGVWQQKVGGGDPLGCSIPRTGKESLGWSSRFGPSRQLDGVAKRAAYRLAVFRDAV